MIYVNVRNSFGQLTGVQRYIKELNKYFINRSGFKFIEPSKPFRSGVKAHLWEQGILPFNISDSDLLWSPATTGPILLENQIVTVHDISALDFPEWYTPQFAYLHKVVLPKLFRKVRAIVAISNFTKRRLIEKCSVDPQKITVIYNGVDERFFEENIKEIDIKNVLEIPTDRYILSLCSLAPRKNLKKLLEAWALSVDYLPDDITLVLAGGKGKKEVFSELELNNIPPKVKFLGYVQDELLPPLYSKADSFVYLSKYEGFGLPPLEAMASGTLPLVSNLTAIPEVVGDIGIKVDPDDIEQISNKIIEVTNSKNIDSQACINRAKKFTWDRTAKSYLKLFEEIS